MPQKLIPKKTLSPKQIEFVASWTLLMENKNKQPPPPFHPFPINEGCFCLPACTSPVMNFKKRREVLPLACLTGDSPAHSRRTAGRTGYSDDTTHPSQRAGRTERQTHITGRIDCLKEAPCPTQGPSPLQDGHAPGTCGYRGGKSEHTLT